MYSMLIAKLLMQTTMNLLVSSTLHSGDTSNDRVSRSAVTVAMAAIPPVLRSPW